MTNDELAVLDVVRGFRGSNRVPRKDIADRTRLSVDRVNKALDGLEASGHVWQLGEIVRLASDGKTFDT